MAPPAFDPRLNSLGQQLVRQGGRLLAAEPAAPALATGSAVAAGAGLQAAYVGSALVLGKTRLELGLRAAQQNDPALAMGGVVGGNGFILPAGTDAGDAGEFFSLRQTDPTAADRKLAEIQNRASGSEAGAWNAGGSSAQADRLRTAREFMQQSGMGETEIPGHLAGVNADKPVNVVTVPKGARLVQWQKPGSSQGSYYAEPGVDPAKLAAR